MFTRIALAGSLAGLAIICPLGTRPLAAQRAATPYQLTPYAGYMIFGDMVRGPLGTSLSNANGAVYGAQLGVKLTDDIAIVGNVGRASADMRVGVPFLSGVTVGSSSMWLYDGGLQLTLPAAARAALPIAPFVQVGAGAISYEVRSGPVRTTSTNVAYNAGVGADVPLGGSVGLRLMAKDYVGRFDAHEATSLPVRGELSHNWALSAGLRLGF